MKKLELKHLAPYLPYKLKIAFDGEEYTHNLVGLEDSVDGIELISEFGDFGRATFDKAKPILHPLSDLIKEIEVNGEKFVPNHNRLFKYFIESDLQYFIDNCPEFTQWHQIQKLFEWHFDVFGLIEQKLAVNINEL